MQRTHRGVALDTVFDENGTRRGSKEERTLILTFGFPYKDFDIPYNCQYMARCYSLTIGPKPLG